MQTIGKFLCDVWVGQGANECKQLDEIAVGHLGWARLKLMQTIRRSFCMTSGLGRLELDANNWLMFLYDIWARQDGNGCNQLEEVTLRHLCWPGWTWMRPIGAGFGVTSGLCRMEIQATNWERFLCVTSGLGRAEMDAGNCYRFLCDIWAGQGGNGCKQLEEVSV